MIRTYEQKVVDSFINTSCNGISWRGYFKEEDEANENTYCVTKVPISVFYNKSKKSELIKDDKLPSGYTKYKFSFYLINLDQEISVNIIYGRDKTLSEIATDFNRDIVSIESYTTTFPTKKYDNYSSLYPNKVSSVKDQLINSPKESLRFGIHALYFAERLLKYQTLLSIDRLVSLYEKSPARLNQLNEATKFTMNTLLDNNDLQDHQLLKFVSILYNSCPPIFEKTDDRLDIGDYISNNSDYTVQSILFCAQQNDSSAHFSLLRCIALILAAFIENISEIIDEENDSSANIDIIEQDVEAFIYSNPTLNYIAHLSNPILQYSFVKCYPLVSYYDPSVSNTNFTKDDLMSIIVTAICCHIYDCKDWKKEIITNLTALCNFGNHKYIFDENDAKLDSDGLRFVIKLLLLLDESGVFTLNNLKEEELLKQLSFLVKPKLNKNNSLNILEDNSSEYTDVVNAINNNLIDTSLSQALLNIGIIKTYLPVSQKFSIGFVHSLGLSKKVRFQTKAEVGQ